MTLASFPPYEMLDSQAIEAAREKTKRLERLYHLTREHVWDGTAVLDELVEKHGPVGKDMPEKTRRSLLAVLSLLLWGELAAWNISADLALAIDDVDAKMAATGQVFDEARHFDVLRRYVLMLAHGDGKPVEIPPLGGLARHLLVNVMSTDSLAKKLVGMQLLFETNAVVIFRRLADAGVCPVLTGILPYFERDESRHVGLGVLYLPRLIEKMSRREALSTSAFQTRCILMLISGGLTMREHFEYLGLDQRLLATRVTSMQDDIIRQMVSAHGRIVARSIVNPKASFLGPRILDFLHPPEGLAKRPPLHKALHRTIAGAARALDRALA